MGRRSSFGIRRSCSKSPGHPKARTIIAKESIERARDHVWVRVASPEILETWSAFKWRWSGFSAIRCRCTPMNFKLSGIQTLRETGITCNFSNLQRSFRFITHFSRIFCVFVKFKPTFIIIQLQLKHINKRLLS